MSKKYRHRKFAGSPGDVWKHFIFLDILLKLDVSKQLKILDTHGGDGYYPLHYGAAWKRGFSLVNPRFVDLDIKLKNHPYFIIEESFFCEKKTYLGFWALAREFFNSSPSQCNFTMDVYENQEEVYSDMLKFIKKFPSKATLSLYNASSSDLDYSGYDLAFIDPTYRRKDNAGDDWAKVVDLCKELEKKSCLYALWYPVYNEDFSQNLWKTLQCRSLELSWHANKDFKYASSGSGILVSNEIFDRIKESIELYQLVAKSLNGDFTLRA